MCKEFLSCLYTLAFNHVCKKTVNLIPHNTTYILFRLHPRNHNLMPAACTFQPKVRTDPQHLPLRRTAGMLLFHF